MNLLQGGLVVLKTVIPKKNFNNKTAQLKYSKIKIQQILKIIYFKCKIKKLLKKNK